MELANIESSPVGLGDERIELELDSVFDYRLLEVGKIDDVTVEITSADASRVNVLRQRMREHVVSP